MTNKNTMIQKYLELRKDVEKVYVVPEIPTKDAEIDYLYLLYNPIIRDFEKHNISVVNLSISEYPKIVFSRIKGEKSIYHHHWYHLNKLQNFFYFVWRTYWILLYRLVGGTVLWTVHNIAPHHGKFKLFNSLSRKFLALIASKLHVHCNEAIEIMSKKLWVRKKKFFIVEIPQYPAKLMPRKEAIKELNEKYVNNSLKEDDLIFLSFGLIGKYKRIKETTEIFSQLEKNKKLIIAGKVRNVEKEYLDEIKQLIKNHSNILLIDKAIPNDAVPIFFNSADYLILNYDKLLTSAVLHLGLSYNKKIIVVDKGCIKDEQDEKIIRFKEESQLKEIISSL